MRVLVRYVDAAGEHVATGEDLVATPPPAAPAHDTYVSNLPLDFAVNGYGPLERDRNNGEPNPRDGGPTRLDGVICAKGLGFNARGVAGVHLGGRCGRFSAQVGIDDAKDNGAPVIFRVIGDGRMPFDSGRMTGATPAKSIGVDVTGVRKPKLVADPRPATARATTGRTGPTPTSPAAARRRGSTACATSGVDCAWT